MNLWIRILVSAGAVSLAILHNCSVVKIDTITLLLLIFALIPWFSNLIESFEIGGVKFNLKKLQNIVDKAKAEGLISEDLTSAEKKKYSFQLVETEDPILALAGLRIEMEKRLKLLAEKNNVVTPAQGVRRLAIKLKEKKVIGEREYMMIADIIGVLNRAIHAEKIHVEAIDWTMEYGPKILKALDEKIKKKL